MREFSPASNPFATRWIRPGALPYLFPSGETVENLVHRLREQGWWGEIVGPHGAGKSTLLATLLPRLSEAGRRPWLVELHDGQRRLPVALSRTASPDPATLLVVDGYEKLGRWSRFRVKQACRRLGWGLLATAHDSVGLPELCRVTPQVETARRVVERLLAGNLAIVTPEDVARSFADRAGNLREVLFDLYDLFDRRRGA
ncbi:MAG: P-loop NTPase family protein [Pirellulales bacterium]